MKKYLFKRIMLSLFSLVAVILIVLILVYNLMNRDNILRSDPRYTKTRYNEREVLKYDLFYKYGYLTYYSAYADEIYQNADEDTKFYASKAINKSETVDQLIENELVSEIVRKYNRMGYNTVFLPTVYNKKGTILSKAQLLFVRESSVFERMGSFFKNLFHIETIWDVKDENLKAEDRYVKVVWDRYSNMPALIGNGTTHKYLIYFDDKFPFIHQNIFHINLGQSHILADGMDVVDYMKQYSGEAIYREEYFPKDLDDPNAVKRETAYDFHTATYSTQTATPESVIYYPLDDHYIVSNQYLAGMSRIGTSFVIGLIGVLLAYIIGLPIGVWMAQRKDKLVDKLGNLYIIFIMAVPSLAYIYMFSTVGKLLFHLPTKYVHAEVKWLALVLPTISLALPSVAGLMKWMRRYMIDQQNSDYVKFARSQGLSEGEIFGKHISRNAFIFLVHGVPANILGTLVGAIITESVYGIPGIGRMLTESISSTDNAVIVGVTVFYTVLTIVSLIAGDLLLAKYDPRISLSGDRR